MVRTRHSEPVLLRMEGSQREKSPANLDIQLCLDYETGQVAATASRANESAGEALDRLHLLHGEA